MRVKDVARVELGAQSSDTFSRFNGAPAASLAIFLALPAPTPSRPLTRSAPRSTDWRSAIPPTCGIRLFWTATTFVKATIVEVLRTLAEAFVLVVLVVFLFLGSWRATLVPIIAVLPVSLIGSPSVCCSRSAIPPTPSRCSRLCSRSALSSTTPSSWWRTCSASWRRRAEAGAGGGGAHRAMREITGTDHRHHPGPAVRVRSDRLPSRHYRRALSTVCRRGVRGGDHFGDQRAHPQSGVMRFAAASGKPPRSSWPGSSASSIGCRVAMRAL